MSPLASRKQLLIAESEINRARLAQDWRAIADDVHALAEQARTVRSLAAMALSLASSLASLRQKSAAAAGKPSWLQTILKGAQMAGSLWSEFRTPKK